MSVKDVTVANWIPNWDPKSGRPVASFLRQAEMAAEMGSLVEKDKVRIILLKVQGASQIFTDTHPEIKEEIRYVD